MKLKRRGVSTGHGTGTQHVRDLHAVLEAERGAKRAKLGARREASARRLAARIGRKVGDLMTKRTQPADVIAAMAIAAGHVALAVVGREDEI